eukprot:maker-scaffold343_size201629-snap-gene-0.7 protein:Tk08441 transcript:maker-scaffold343_size201629-snap-gene-0.7-mRNA-1 annotation:"gdp-l-fucose synthase"
MVTGGNGLAGQAIRSIVDQGEAHPDETWIFVSRQDAYLMDLEATRKLFERHQPTHVIHLAAMVGGLFHNMRNGLDFFRTNMRINDNVLSLSHEFDAQKVISCSSTCVYPNKLEYPLDETKLHLGPPHESNFGFAYAKRMIDVLNQGYALKYGRKFTSFIYSLDLARLLVWAMRYYEEIEPIIFSVDESAEISISDLTQLIVKAFDFKGEVVYQTDKADGQLKKTASIAKMRRHLPDFQFTPMEQAVRETVEWFKANYEAARK